MGLWDTLTSASTWNTVGSIASAAGSIYDIYSAYQNNQLAQQYANLAFGSAEAQDAYAKEAWNRQKELYWPLEDLQIQYSLEDLKTLRPAYQNQINYQAQRLDEQLEQSKYLNPLIDSTERDLLGKLMEGEDVIAERLMNQASADISLAYGAQRESDLRSLGVAGVNPNSGQTTNYLSRLGTSEALAQATGRTQAARQAEELAINRQSTALNYARGAELPSYTINGSVDSSTIIGGLGNSGQAYSNLASYYNNNSQNSLNGAWYLLNQLSGGNINAGY